MNPAEMRPGDILLYRPAGLFGRLIAIKTWHRISHVEVFIGPDGQGGYVSVASRDGQGVNFYPTRQQQLAYVLRPARPFRLGGSLAYARSMVGTPYGWFDLLNFFGADIDHHGIVCSPFVVSFFRAGDWIMFPEDEVNDVAPFQFLDLIDHGVTKVYSDGKGLR